MTETRSAGGTALFVLVLSLAAGGLAGLAIGAVKAGDGGFFSTDWALMTEQPLTHAEKTFNWLLFCLFAAAGIVAAVAAWAAVTVSNSIVMASSKELTSLAALKPAGTPPLLPPMRATAPIDPPHL